jgi:hypothetical protein
MSPLMDNQTSISYSAPILRRETGFVPCTQCVFVCPAVVHVCGCARVWGVPTLISAALLLASLLSMLAIVLQW